MTKSPSKVVAKTTKPSTKSVAGVKVSSPAKVSVKAIEAKALKAESKSEGMRVLFAAGYKVTEVQRVFNAPYGFVYGVAQRAGFAQTAASRKVAKAEPKSVKAITKPKAKVGPVKAKATKAATVVVKTPAQIKRVASKVTSSVKARAANPPTVLPTPSVKKVPVANGTQSAVARVAARIAAKSAGAQA